MTKFRHLIWTMVAAAGLMLSVSPSFAQKPDVGDQPGLIADDSVELDPQFRKHRGALSHLGGRRAPSSSPPRSAISI